MAPWRSWTKLIRPIDTSNAALLALGSYPRDQLLSWENWWQSLATTTAIFAATMLWNAWYDRKHDLLMERPFANEHSQILGALTAAAWGVVLWFLYRTYESGTEQEFALLTGMALGGFGYAWARLVPYLSTAVVATVFAAPTLLGVTDITTENILFALLVFFVNVNREILGDIRDEKFDRVGPWKKTIPVLWGQKVALHIYTSTVIVSSTVVVFLAATSLQFSVVFLLAGVAALALTYIPLTHPSDESKEIQKLSIKQAASLINFTLYCYSIGLILS